MARKLKKVLTNATSNFLFTTGILEIWRVCSRRLNKDKVTILAYHRVVDLDQKPAPFYEKNVSCSPQIFEKQMIYLRSKFNLISLEDYVDARKSGTALPPSSVLITFDDGYRDVYENAYPILRKYKIPATLFVTVDFVESVRTAWWDKMAFILKQTPLDAFRLKGLGTFTLRTKQDKRQTIEKLADKFTLMDEQALQVVMDELARKLNVNGYQDQNYSLYINWKNLREMAENGIHIGSHTMSHPNLTRLDNSRLDHELKESRRFIEEQTLAPVKHFAYPYGHNDHINATVTAAVKHAGFSSACTTISGRAKNMDNLYKLKRMPIFYYNNMNTFIAKVVGIFDIFYKT